MPFTLNFLILFSWSDDQSPSKVQSVDSNGGAMSAQELIDELEEESAAMCLNLTGQPTHRIVLTSL
jgi:hypothetical protein